MVPAGGGASPSAARRPARPVACRVERVIPAMRCRPCGGRVGPLADAVVAVKAARSGTRVLVGGGITSVPGLGTTVGADGVAHSLAEALSLARVNRTA